MTDAPEPDKPFTVRLDTEDGAALAWLSKKEKLSRSDIIRVLIRSEYRKRSLEHTAPPAPIEVSEQVAT